MLVFLVNQVTNLEKVIHAHIKIKIQQTGIWKVLNTKATRKGCIISIRDREKQNLEFRCRGWKGACAPKI